MFGPRFVFGSQVLVGFPSYVKFLFGRMVIIFFITPRGGHMGGEEISQSDVIVVDGTRWMIATGTEARYRAVGGYCVSR